MPRRASSSLHPSWIIGTILVIILAVIGGRLILIKLNDPFRTIPQMEVAAYLENSDSLRGNSYKLQARILNSLAWTPDKGRLFSIESEGTDSEAVLPILIPEQFNDTNIQRGQVFIFEIEVGRNGILIAKSLKKA